MSDKPLPRVNAINRPFWEGCNRGERIDGLRHEMATPLRRYALR